MMQRAPITARRSGYTLLEVLLASALAVVLMGALYASLDIQLKLADDGRGAIEQATVSRAICRRLSVDLSNAMGPVFPPPQSTQAMTPPPGGAATDPNAETTTTLSSEFAFQAGVIGTSEQLSIYVTKVAGYGRGVDESGETVTPGDIRRITYWMTDGGFARQEIPWITAQEYRDPSAVSLADDRPESSYVMAEEVRRVEFEYWDGSSWLTSWDGSELGADGVSPKGPPPAIRIRFWMTIPGQRPGETTEKEFRHTISLLTAPGPAVPDTAAANMAGAP